MLSTTKDTTTLIPHIKELLIEKDLILSTAESCTGGNIARCLTLVPGISKVFKGGVVAYCNDAKMNILGVRRNVIDYFTEVSDRCAREMAEGANKVMCSNISISTTGFAEPNNLDIDDPKRQQAYICICYNSGRGSSFRVKHILPEYEKTRERFINHVTSEALCLLVEVLDRIMVEEIE